MLLTFILLFVCVALIYYYYHHLKNYNRDYWKVRNVVEESRINWKFFLGDRSYAEVIKDVYDGYPNQPYVGIFQGVKPALVVRDLKNIKAILSSDFESFHSRGILTNENDLLADNLLFMDNYLRWKLVRLKLLPVLMKFNLQVIFYIIERCAMDFVELIEDNQYKREHAFKALYTYVTASIASCLFGIEAQKNSTMESPFLDMAWRSIEPTKFQKIKFFIANTFPKVFKFMKFKFFGEHEDFFMGVIKKEFEERMRTRIMRYDLLDTCVVLQLYGQMFDVFTSFKMFPTSELWAAQAFSFFVIGVDATSSAMHFTLLELSNNPGVLKKLHEEIDTMFKECNENITYERIEDLKYLNQVVNEALRKYPPIGVIQRRCTKDTILPVGDLKIEKDTIVILPIYAIHRDEKYYPNPELFDPERFGFKTLDELDTMKFQYLAFGEGNRICMGAKYAQIIMKIGLAWLLRRFTLKEQSCTPERFEYSHFKLRARDLYYDLIPREGSIKN